jgi:hypothetical protein
MVATGATNANTDPGRATAAGTKTASCGSSPHEPTFLAEANTRLPSTD